MVGFGLNYLLPDFGARFCVVFLIPWNFLSVGLVPLTYQFLFVVCVEIKRCWFRMCVCKIITFQFNVCSC